MIHCKINISNDYFGFCAVTFVDGVSKEPTGGGLLGWVSFPPLKSEKLFQSLIALFI